MSLDCLFVFVFVFVSLGTVRIEPCMETLLAPLEEIYMAERNLRIFVPLAAYSSIPMVTIRARRFEWCDREAREESAGTQDLSENAEKA